MALAESRQARLELLIERGRLAYELGLYLEAVTAWEQAWREESGRMRRVLQGLMQAAGAYHKQRLEQPLATVKLLAMALERLDTVPDGLGDLGLEAFREGLERSQGEALAWAAGGPNPGPAALLTRSYRS